MAITEVAVDGPASASLANVGIPRIADGGGRAPSATIELV